VLLGREEEALVVADRKHSPSLTDFLTLDLGSGGSANSEGGGIAS
jgi:hypothetical protein